MSAYVPEEYLFGIKYWAQYFNWAPKYEIWVYRGYSFNKELFYFQSKRKPAVIMSRHVRSLTAPDFKPFMWDRNRVARAAENAPEAFELFLKQIGKL